jgi:hypothetical protein
MFSHLTLKEKRIFLTAQEFLEACVSYFQWCVDTPLEEENIFQYKGSIVRGYRAKVRPFTKTGLAQYLSIPVSRLEKYRERGEDWAEAVELVEQAIYTQKFENAAAGLLNSTIIARDLGLAEKQELGGIVDAPPVAFNITPIKAGTFVEPVEEKAPEADAT